MHLPRHLEPGRPAPLGATAVEGGVNFAVFSAHASRIDLVIFDEDGMAERARLALPERAGHVRHGFLPHAGPGLVYGLRAHGPNAPEQGLRFDAAKLLVDPYARRLIGPFDPDPSQWRFGADTAATSPKSVVGRRLARRHRPERPRTPWGKTVVYEAHVKGLTKLHDGIEERLRGTYAALADPYLVDHLLALGVTAVELLPVHAFVSEPFLVDKGLVNYWGYNTLGFFAPHPAYAAGDDPVEELERAIDRLHDAGIEVILDVVYNHTAEGNESGPTLAWRGLDNPTYYLLDPHDPGRYLNHSGCGNTLNAAHPAVLRMIMDSLRHWHADIGVDGFRFDLAASLGRLGHGFDRRAPFLQTIAQDPALVGAKLIAEPWDVGPSGYQLGAFPEGWAEWNDRFRDASRRFWRGDEGLRPEIAKRLTASAEEFDHDGRRPWASINYVASHDGFTLADLVSYAEKHNEANLEANHDGTRDNYGFNHGAEGPSDDPRIRLLRDQHRRALLATLFLSQGVPMLRAGDELGQSQNGNNNAYCQDGPISWIDWALADMELVRFVARLSALRRDLPALRAPTFLHGAPGAIPDLPDIAWFGEDGKPKTKEAWTNPKRRSIGLWLAASKPPLLMLLNGHDEAIYWNLPEIDGIAEWRTLLDTSDPQVPDGHDSASPGADRIVPPRALLLFEAVPVPIEAEG